MDAARPSHRARILAIVLVLVGSGVLGLSLGAPRASAATTYYLAGSACTGSSTPTWVAGDTWVLYRNAWVPVGCVLTIQPGVTVMADPSVHLYVQGVLHSDGVAGTPVTYIDNQTAVTPWAGIQFNATASGSVTWSSFNRVQIAVEAQSSSPTIANNTIVLASGAVRLDASSSVVADNTIDGRGVGAIGLILVSSTATVTRNSINGTVVGIQAMTSGAPAISDNRLTNISGTLTLGMYIDGQSSVIISGNTIENMQARDGGTGVAGGSAAAILINGTATVTVVGNTISTIQGGRGGAGASNALSAGGAGGNAGASAGIAIGGAATVRIEGNTLTTILGGRGGDGGASGVLAGGPGGAGGIAFGIEVFSASSGVSFIANTVNGVLAGDGGAGGSTAGGSLVPDGPGGAGAAAYGIFSLGGVNANLSGNTIQQVEAGAGGSSIHTPASRAIPGSGGDATGLVAFVNASTTVQTNVLVGILGGAGGDGFPVGGYGGNVTGVLALGAAEGFNTTAVRANDISGLTGGAGGIGGTRSGPGGNVTGIAALHVNASLASNQIADLTGGAGGTSYTITNAASGGGSAAGVGLFQVPGGSSLGDSIQSIVPGAPGGTVSPPASLGAGYYLAGNATIESVVAVTNATLASIGNFDFYVDNYTAATSLNTSFSAGKVAVMVAANLTVRNFLGVTALWPNNITAVWGARVAVKDNGVEIYNRTMAFGVAKWIAVTNRVYVGSAVPAWNVTQVTVTYPSYAFAKDPRNVNVTATQTQTFTMIDKTAPASDVVALPAWTAARTFPVYVTCGDGFGVGVANVTLWYNRDGTGWTTYGLVTSFFFGIGQFSFAATVDGLYQFAATAIDRAGNAQPSPPTANETWTIVDTTAPASHVIPLPRYETSATFAVSWAPNAGVSDVANYTVQVNTGSGWTAWLTNTTATSAAFTATAQGPVAFRTLARDYAGNLESKSANDTWTIVDTMAPQVVSRSPTGNLTASPTTITIAFSEAMNASSVEGALQISPAVGGTYSWDNASKTLTITLDQSLPAGTAYTVTIGTGARDLAGNALAQPSVFTFATPAAPPAPGLSLLDLWPLFVVLAVALAAVALFLVRRRGAASAETVAETPKPVPPPAPAQMEAAIDDIFLLYQKDGVLIKHETRRLRPDIDSDILSGMLNAVQQFVKDALLGAEGDELSEMVLGQMHILIGRGKWLVLAATITGGDMASMNTQIQKVIQDMEDHNWDRLEDWDGDMDLAKVLSPYLKKLIRGEYA